VCVLFCFVLFVLFCFVLFCFVLFCFVLFSWGFFLCELSFITFKLSLALTQIWMSHDFLKYITSKIESIFIRFLNLYVILNKQTPSGIIYISSVICSSSKGQEKVYI